MSRPSSHTLTSQAQRQRRYRARQKAGVQVLLVEIGNDLIGRWIEAGHITSEEALDQRRLAEVAGSVMRDDV